METEDFIVDEAQRLDNFLSQKLSQSRSQISNFIKNGYVDVDGKNILKPGLKLKPNQTVCVKLPEVTKEEPLEVDFDVEILYEDDDVLVAGKKRATWLGINLITAILASLAIAFFEDTLQNLVALAILMPIVASMGGNAGTQSLTVVVRQLALGDISSKDAKRIIKKEVLISLGNGLIFAVIMGAIASLWFNIHLLGTVIALSMIINLLSAGFFGAVVPFVLKKLNVDPAIGSAVVLTTTTDIVGFISFLGLATLIL